MNVHRIPTGGHAPQSSLAHDCYPFAAGHRGIDTSIMAADSIAETVGSLRHRIHAVIEAAGVDGATGDEVAERVGMERYAARPRLSELRKQKRIVDTGKRRRNRESGRLAIVWAVSEREARHD